MFRFTNVSITEELFQIDYFTIAPILVIGSSNGNNHFYEARMSPVSVSWKFTCYIKYFINYPYFVKGNISSETVLMLHSITNYSVRQTAG